MIVITGASGQLGRLVIGELLKTVPAGDIVAAVRSPEKVDDFKALGVEVRRADYEQPETLEAAFAGADKLLLISSSEVGQRAKQHGNVIDAAKKADVGFIAYTSLLHADTTPLGLGVEHKQTEAFLAESGIPHAVLRNGWYTENFTGSIDAALENGVILGCYADGRIASATRADYAEAAAAVLVGDGHAGKKYELAGDEAYTMEEYAAVVSEISGKKVEYKDMTEKEYADALRSAGLPDVFAEMLADSAKGASKGGLFDDGKDLSALIKRPATPLTAVVKAALNR